MEPITEREDIAVMARFADCEVKSSQWVLRMLLAHRTFSPTMVGTMREASTLDEGIAAMEELEGTPQARSCCESRLSPGGGRAESQKTAHGPSALGFSVGG